MDSTTNNSRGRADVFIVTFTVYAFLGTLIMKYIIDSGFSGLKRPLV